MTFAVAAFVGCSADEPASPSPADTGPDGTCADRWFFDGPGHGYCNPPCFPHCNDDAKLRETIDLESDDSATADAAVDGETGNAIDGDAAEAIGGD